MANKNIPTSPTHNGWWYDALNARLEYYFRGTKVGHLDASGMSITDDSTARMTDGLVQTAGLAAGAVTDAKAAGTLKNHVARLGSVAAVASNGAGAIEADCAFVAPADLTIVAARRLNLTASDVTKGTSTTSASYRRMTLITNTAGTGSGTNIVASLNATASAASKVTRGFATVASTVPAGAIVLLSHLTVGAETADGTDAAACIVEIEYELA